MQIRITINLDEPLTLPVNYNHIIQSIIYHALSDYPEFADAAHNEGFSYANRKYKTFTFSNLKGHYTISNKKITFYDSLQFEIRSPFIPFINIVGNHFADQGIDFGRRYIDTVDVEPLNVKLDDTAYYIKMASPICVYSTDPETGWTDYYSPYDEELYYQISMAFGRKYCAFIGEAPPGGFVLIPDKISERDKVITDYKGTIIEAWMGEYILKGDPECLTFLYDSGIGSRNPEGFGMFDVIETIDSDYTLDE